MESLSRGSNLRIIALLPYKDDREKGAGGKFGLHSLRHIVPQKHVTNLVSAWKDGGGYPSVPS